MSADEFLTILEPGHAQTRVLGSRFIGRALAIRELDDVANELASERQHYYDATHWCHAARLGWGPRLIEKSSDAGEPHGTAGVPLLRELQGRRITDALVIVTRYFGGTKLGTGNLARAYAECAAMTLDSARTETRQRRAVLCVRCSSQEQNLVYTLARRYGASLKAESETDAIIFHVSLPFDRRADFRQVLLEESRGRVSIDEGDA